VSLNLSLSQAFGYGKTVPLHFVGNIFCSHFTDWENGVPFHCFSHDDWQYLTMTVVGLEFKMF